jgi:polygalacturonase
LLYEKGYPVEVVYDCFSFAFAQKEKLPVIKSPVFKKDTLSIKKYGAVSDGNTLNTKSINATIDALSKKGGGVVLIPSGLWLTGRWF